MDVNLLLDIDSKHPHFELFAEFGQKLEFNGRTVLDVSCEYAEFSSPFVRIQLAAPKNLQGLTLWIQSHQVIYAYQRTDKKQIGFSPSLKPPS